MPDDKKILQDSCAEARQYQRKVNRNQSAKLLPDLQTNGMVFNEVAPSEIDRMRQKLKPVVDKYTKEVVEELIKQTYAEIDKPKKQK